MLVVSAGHSSDVEATTVGLAVVDAPRVMVDKTLDSETNAVIDRLGRRQRHDDMRSIETASQVGGDRGGTLNGGSASFLADSGYHALRAFLPEGHLRGRRLLRWGECRKP